MSARAPICERTHGLPVESGGDLLRRGAALAKDDRLRAVSRDADEARRPVGERVDRDTSRDELGVTRAVERGELVHHVREVAGGRLRALHDGDVLAVDENLDGVLGHDALLRSIVRDV